ncbi:MAG: transglycosylase SLT domain-containing protein [Bosea sp. (in: a-proteobacteria)]
MRYTSSAALAAISICLLGASSSQAMVNDERDQLAFIVREGEIARAKAAGQAQEAAPEAAVAETGKKVAKIGKADTRVHAAPAGSDGLRALVARHAAANGVPFSLADAFVRVESRYNPRAANAGNYGLMQIRYQTARGMGYSGPASGLLDADTNARYAMKYLAQAYRMAGGDTCRTVMKYQSGHMAERMSGANRAYCSKIRTYTAQN